MCAGSKAALLRPKRGQRLSPKRQQRVRKQNREGERVMVSRAPRGRPAPRLRLMPERRPELPSHPACSLTTATTTSFAF